MKDYVGDIFIRVSIIIVAIASITYVIYNVIQDRKINKALIAKQASGKKK